MRVLVIDEQLVGQAFARSLRSHDVLVESNPRGAIQRIRQGEPFDLIICDRFMPGCDGLEVLAAVRDLGDLRPYFVMTTGSDEFCVGVDAFLFKPFSSAQLAEIVMAARVRRAG